MEHPLTTPGTRWLQSRATQDRALRYARALGSAPGGRVA